MTWIVNERQKESLELARITKIMKQAAEDVRRAEQEAAEALHIKIAEQVERATNLSRSLAEAPEDTPDRLEPGDTVIFQSEWVGIQKDGDAVVQARFRDQVALLDLGKGSMVRVPGLYSDARRASAVIDIRLEQVVGDDTVHSDIDEAVIMFFPNEERARQSAKIVIKREDRKLEVTPDTEDWASVDMILGAFEQPKERVTK